MKAWAERIVFAFVGYAIAMIVFAVAAMVQMSGMIPSAPALSAGQIPREHYRGLPPPEFRGEWTGIVKFVDDVSTHCGSDAYACGDAKGIIMPNPCTPDAMAEVGWSTFTGSLSMKRKDSWPDEDYRTTMCHEIGHAHGWPGNHWIATETEIAQLQSEIVEALYVDDQTQGGMVESWILNGSGVTKEKKEAALAALIASGDARRHQYKGYAVIRLDGCKYWTMRQERNGDGSKKMKEWCRSWDGE